TARQVPLEQRLDELRDELPQVGMEAVDVLRPLALGQVALGPGKLQVDAGVEGVLRRGHGPDGFDTAVRTPAPRAPICRNARRRRRNGSSSGRARDSPRAMPTQLGAPGALSRASPSRADRRTPGRTCP